MPQRRSPPAVRDPRRGVAWTQARVRRRSKYSAYITSPAWFRRRESWVAAYTLRHGTGPVCAGCGGAWSVAHGDLHHITYARLGAEHDADLVALCRVCHSTLHDLWDASPAWRRLGRVTATRGILALLRTRKATT